MAQWIEHLPTEQGVTGSSPVRRVFLLLFKIMNIDEMYMEMALKEAYKALDEKEVPVGAVAVYQGKIIAKAHNQTEILKDATAHAEMIAITQAASTRGDWRLDGVTLYVTKEPCVMCAGALVNSRVEKLVYGVSDPLRGAAGSLKDLVRDSSLPHQLEVVTGIKEKECRDILQRFFQVLRRKEQIKYN